MIFTVSLTTVSGGGCGVGVGCGHDERILGLLRPVDDLWGGKKSVEIRSGGALFCE